MMKNTFYLTLMAVLVLKIFIFLNFCLDGFGHAEKLDDKKGKVNFKIYDVKNWKTLITIHIVSNVSKSKGNQAINFFHSIEYEVRNISLEKSL